MQMTLAVAAEHTIDLVLAAWSDACPAQQSVAPESVDGASFDAIMAQLTLPLDTVQIPLWDRRTA